MIYASLTVLVLLAGILILLFNRLVTLRNRFKNAFSQIDVQLKRRHDLVPNLVETARAYISHERQTLEAVIAARNRAAGAAQGAAADPTNAQAIKELGEAETGLTAALGRLFALQENYPDLKANQVIGQLAEELTSTENRIAFARQAFNDGVMRYNTACETFPGNLVAGAFGFATASLFELDDRKETEPVRVDLR